ncbi:MAG: S8 family serine peptidase [Candidatus Methanoplasma sp.]|nr:S8 family serine peptidase [Candidatus Methanoplasma sp.]
MNRIGIFSIVAVTVLLMAAVPMIGKGSEEIGYADHGPEEKKISDASPEDDFADNGVLVVLNRETTRNFKTYVPEDFPEIKCSKVIDLTGELSVLAKEQYGLKKTTDNAQGNELNIDDFRAILYLELEERGKENVLAAIKQLEEREDILSAGPDYVGSVSAVPNDLYLGRQWAVNNMGLPSAWNSTTGSSSVTVAVMDTGIDGTHPDLTNRINRSMSRDFVSGSAVAVDDPVDPHGHGTHVAGIIGAQGNNGIGIAGTCWDVTLVSLRVFDSSGRSTDSTIISAINYASVQGIPILNHSGASTQYNYAVEQAVRNYPGLYVAAAGNENNNNDGGTRSYPASFRLDNLISVGATSANDDKASFSNYGIANVDIFAPGESIYSTLPGSYGIKGGTSMATPYVAGVAALLLAKNQYTPFGLKSVLMDSVDKKSELRDYCVSGGRLNAYKALNANLFGGGNGTSDNPYLISTVQHLRDINKLGVYDSHAERLYVGANKHYKLTSNITLSGEWMPASGTTVLREFCGTFDGNGKTISGLSSTSTATGYFGLFEISSGTIRNLTLNNVNINKDVGSSHAITGIGAITGYNRGMIDNCTVNGTITTSGMNIALGGLAGFNYSYIKNSTNNAAVTNNGTVSFDTNSSTGGIVGIHNGGSVVNCTNNGAVTGNDRTGGIAGYCEYSKISNCTANATANNVAFSWRYVSDYNAAGGIAGGTFNAKVENCTFKGTIKYTNQSSASTSLQPKIGQIVGYSYKTTLTSNTASGSVDRGTLQVVEGHNQALYAEQYGHYGRMTT